MVLVDFGVEIKVEASLQTQNVQVIVGACAYPAQPYTTICPGHYLLTMSITPRPPDAWAKLDDAADLCPTPMGNIMLIPVDRVQHGGFQPVSGMRRDVWCLFPKPQFETLAGFQIEWTRAALYAAIDVREPNISAAMRRLAHEAVAPGMAASVLADSIVTTLAIDLRRYFGHAEPDKVAGKYTLAASHLRRIGDYIHAHSQQELRLRDFAEICGMSVRHLTRAFKQTTGCTLANHVSEIRLDIAKELLRNSRLPAKVIAARIGFSNVSSFASAFRRLTGVTPGMFRAELSHGGLSDDTIISPALRCMADN
jgi:AraC family transcriptional regulator